MIRPSGQRVRQLDDIGLCKMLRVLTLGDNFVSKIDSLIRCTRLLKLDLHGNQACHNVRGSLFIMVTKFK